MVTFNFNLFPLLRTNRLILRKLSQNDVNGIFNLHSNEQIIRYTTIKKYEKVEQAIEYINKIEKGIRENKYMVWSLIKIEDNSFLGTICLWKFSDDFKYAQIGYDLLSEFQGNGFMQEAMEEVIKFAFNNIKLKRIIADLQFDNDKSAKILEKNYFKKEYVYDTISKEGIITKMMLYTLKDKKYFKVSKAAMIYE